MALKFAGFAYDDAGAAINGATVNLYDRNTTTPVLATTTTNSSGYWTISHATEGRFDVEIVNGTSKRRIKYDDVLQMEEAEFALLNLRGSDDAFNYVITPAALAAERVLNLPLLTGTAAMMVTPAIEDLDMGGFNIDNGGAIFLKEQAAADPDVAGSGQIWVKTATPNMLQFTNDAGTDFQLDANPNQAVQGSIEAQTDENTYLPPDLVHFSPGVAKCWCKVQTTGALQSPDHGIASITDNGTGDRTVVFDTAFSSSNYGAMATQQGTGRVIYLDTQTTASIHMVSQEADSPYAGHDVLNWFVGWGDFS